MAKRNQVQVLPPILWHEPMLVKRGPVARQFSIAPSRKGDVGYNLTIVENTVVPPGQHLEPTELPVDVCVKLPYGCAAAIWPRSSLHRKWCRLILCQAPIDNGYIGSIGPLVKNISIDPIMVPAGTSLCQLVLFPIVTPPIVDVDELPKTERGTQRFGSTDTRAGTVVRALSSYQEVPLVPAAKTRRRGTR